MVTATSRSKDITGEPKEGRRPEITTQQVEQSGNGTETVQGLATAADEICFRCGELERLQPTGSSASQQKHKNTPTLIWILSLYLTPFFDSATLQGAANGKMPDSLWL